MGGLTERAETPPKKKSTLKLAGVYLMVTLLQFSAVPLCVAKVHLVTEFVAGGELFDRIISRPGEK